MHLTHIKGVLFAVFAATYYYQFIGSTPLMFTHDDVLALRHNYCQFIGSTPFKFTHDDLLALRQNTQCVG